MTTPPTLALLFSMAFAAACRRAPAEDRPATAATPSLNSTRASDPAGFSATTRRTISTASELPLPFPPPPSYVPHGSVSARYDKFKDIWAVISTTIGVDLDKPEGPYNIRSRPMAMYLRVVAVRSGKSPAAIRADDKVAIVLTSEAADWQFLGDRQLRVLADGRRYTFDTMRSSQVAPLEETLITDVPVRQFLEIINASTTEWQAGSHEFRLEPSGSATLKIFASILPLDPEQISALPSEPRKVADTSQPASPVAEGDGPQPERQPSTFADHVRATEAAPKFYIDDHARMFHEPSCPDVRSGTMRLVIKPVVVLKRYTAHSCVSEGKLRGRRWPGAPPSP